MENYGFEVSFYDSDDGIRDFIRMQRLRMKQLMKEKAINVNSIIRDIINSDLVQFFEKERTELIEQANKEFLNPDNDVIINLNYQNRLKEINKFIDNKLSSELTNIINLLEKEDLEKPMPLAFKILSPVVNITNDSDELDSEYNYDPILVSRMEARVLDELSQKLKLKNDEIKHLMKLDPENPVINQLRNKIIYYYKNYIEDKAELHKEVKRRLVDYKMQTASTPIMTLESSPCFYQSSRSYSGLENRELAEKKTSSVQRAMYGKVLINELDIKVKKKSIWD